MTSDRERANVEPVVKRMTVQCTPDEAFRYFTADFGKWWPAHTHSVSAMSSARAKQPASCTFEPCMGGRIIEHGTDDEQHLWGTVIVWEPPRQVAFTWHPGRNERTAQTVEVTFTETARGTEVVLTHSGFEKLAEEAAVTREAYENGWQAVFQGAFRQYAEQSR